jgi:hypothetical protein
MSRMPLLSNGELKIIEVSSPEAKQWISNYWGIAVDHFLDTGDQSLLAPFAGRRIKGLPFETDPEAIEEFWFSTDFDFQEVYEP